MAKIIKLRGPIGQFKVAVGAYSRGGGGSLTICCSRVGAYSGGGLFREGVGNSRIYGMLAICKKPICLLSAEITLKKHSITFPISKIYQ